MKESRESSCPNLGHENERAVVRHCPICGEVVNARVPAKPECRDEHDRRRAQATYCCDCGERIRPH